MDKHDFSRWTAQQPPVDFADRAVGAMLSSEAKKGRARKRRRWPGFLVLAAAFVGTTAWATLSQQRAHEEPSAPVVYVHRLNRSAAVEPVAPPVYLGEPKVAEPSEPAPPPRPPRRVVPPPPPPTVSASAPPKGDLLGPKVVRFPRCECQPHISFCSCIE